MIEPRTKGYNDSRDDKFSKEDMDEVDDTETLKKALREMDEERKLQLEEKNEKINKQMFGNSWD